jgi:hypothetical protein
MSAGAEIGGFEVEKIGLVGEGDGNVEFSLLDGEDQRRCGVAMDVGQRQDNGLRLHIPKVRINLRS